MKYVYINNENNNIEDVTSTPLPTRDGFTEVEVEDTVLELENHQYLVYENGEIIKRETPLEEVEVLLEQKKLAIGYSIDRKREYPAIGDQLDALFHAGAFPADMAAEIQAVKDANPKP